MRKVVILALFVLSQLTASVIADNVQVKLNSGGSSLDDDRIVYGKVNKVEFWYQNTTQLAAAMNCFAFTKDAGISGSLVWLANGNEPSSAVTKYATVEPAYGSVWNLGDWEFGATGMPNSVMTGGAALPGAGLPAHALLTKVWSFSLDATTWSGPDIPNGFCVDNVFLPPGGTWTFDAGSGGYAPNFQGQPNNSQADPSAPPACFAVVNSDCLPPIFTAVPGIAVNRSHCSAFTFDFEATEGGNTPPADPVTYSTSTGTINAATGQLSVPALAGCGTTTVTVTAANSCGPHTDYAFNINWGNNNPTISNCPASPISVFSGNSCSYDLNAIDIDPCDAISWSVSQTAGPTVVGTYSIGGTGVFTFNSASPDDGGKTVTFTAIASDACGGQSSCAFTVEVKSLVPFLIQIEKTHNSLQGFYEGVSITKIGGSELMGGFDFMVAYDASALNFISASLGAGPLGCVWEYFTASFGAEGDCGGSCPSGLIRMVAIADVNGNTNQPTCLNVANGAELVSMKFYVSIDWDYRCTYIPIQFAWNDCGDNTISSIAGDTLWISNKVFGVENSDPYNDPSDEITDATCYSTISYGGACSDCDFQQGYTPVRQVLFWNGGVDLVCIDSIDIIGDLNLNGMPYEIADAVVYIEFFKYGIPGLDPDPYRRLLQIEASDINRDGNKPTVADLVLLLKIIAGEASPIFKLIPFTADAIVGFDEGNFTSQSVHDIGAVYATFKVNGAYTLTSNTNMEVVSAESDGLAKVLVYSGLSNLTNRLEAGQNSLFTIDGNVELVNVEVADYQGNMMNTRINKSVLPTEFKLSQNVPNPFNPTTKIGLELPVLTDWSLEIFNIQGQLVKSFFGHDQGHVQVEWQAINQPSGVYLYKLTAGSFTASRKMVLMK